MNQPTQTSNQNRGCGGCFLRGMGVVTILAFLPLVLYVLLSAVGALLITSDPEKDADMIVLLSGGDRQRWQEAVNFYREKTSRIILITETGDTINEIGTRYSLLVRNNLSAMGVPMDNIRIISEVSRSTVEEAKSVREYMEYWGHKSCIVVTDPYHTFRTRLIFHDTFKGSEVSVQIHAVTGHWYKATTWMFSRQGWEVTLAELAKVAGYLLGFGRED